MWTCISCFVKGFECCGRVTEIGADVSNLAVGDRVLGVTNGGTYADEAVAEQVYINSFCACVVSIEFVIAVKTSFSFVFAIISY